MTRPKLKFNNIFLIGCGWVTTIVIVALGFYFLGTLRLPTSTIYETALVVRVIDGDTIELEDGRSIRYIGINTPETVHPEKDVECFGPEASTRNGQLVEGKYIEMLKGSEDIDKYGRYLRYVFVDGIFVNAQLVSEGYAHASSYGEEKRFQQVFVQLEQYSKLKDRGLWSVCP